MINYKSIALENEYLTIIKPVAKSLTIKPGENIKAQVVDILPNGGVALRVKGQLVEVQSEIPLQKGSQLLLKLLELSDKNVIKFQIIPNNISNTKIENIMNLFKNINTANLLEEFSALKPEFKSILVNNFYSVYDMSKFSEVIKNTGILFENKIKKGQDFKNDMKFKLFTLLSNKEISNEDREKIKQLIKDIQDYQYLSKLTDIFWTFIPVLEKGILDAQFLYKKLHKKSTVHFVLIKLKFKKVGKVDININLIDNSLFINFFIENKNFMDFLKDNLNELKKELNPSFNITFSFFNKTFDEKKLLNKDFDGMINVKI